MGGRPKRSHWECDDSVVLSLVLVHLWVFSPDLVKVLDTNLLLCEHCVSHAAMVAGVASHGEEADSFSCHTSGSQSPGES